MVSPILLIVVPLGLAFAVPLLERISKKLVGYVPVLAMAFNLVLSVVLLRRAVSEPIIVHTGSWQPPFSIHLVAGPLGLLLAALIALIGLGVAVYAMSTIREGATRLYHVLYILLLTGATGIVLTGDLFNLFVFFEILCISSYALVAYRGDRAGIESATKYLIQGAIGSSLALIGIGILYGMFGTLSMADIAQHIHSVAPFGLFMALALLITGFGVEAAIFPLNAWLPDAHSSAPSPISAILSGIAIKVGIYAVARIIFTLYGLETVFLFVAVLGLLTLLIGEMSAFSQNNIKRLLAYSSIGQVGLILFALGIASVTGVTGALFLVVSHGLAKSVLFLSVGVMITRTGSAEISSLDGMGKRMPLSALCFTIGAFSLIGLPPFVGFAAKFTVVRAVFEQTSTLFTVLIGVALLGTVVEAAYFFRIVQRLYFKPPPEGSLDHAGRGQEAPLSALIPIGILTVVIIVAGVYPGLFSSFLEPAATDLLDKAVYIRHVLGG